MKNQNRLARQVMETLQNAFGAPNDAMFRKTGDMASNFFNTGEPRVKVAVLTALTKECDVKSIQVTIAVEEEDRPGMYFALGDRLHFDTTKPMFAKFQYHKELRNKLSTTSAATDFPAPLNSDVLAFATELTKVL
jgi:hypothetical protein